MRLSQKTGQISPSLGALRKNRRRSGMKRRSEDPSRPFFRFELLENQGFKGLCEAGEIQYPGFSSGARSDRD
jgi:hypothetical protein